MKVLRIELTQRSAQYRRPETVSNKMTYPLPFPSTVIGALHSACGYKEYHPMNVSIQGQYGALQEEVYVDHCFLNTVMDDRGMLVKVPNGDLLTSRFERVAKAKKPQGNSFKKGITIDVINPSLMAEYRQLLKKKEELDQYKKNELVKAKAPLEAEIKALQQQQKGADGAEKKKLKEKIKEVKAELKQYEAAFKEREREEYTLPISRFKNLTTSPKRYEILYDIKLILHIQAEPAVLQDIFDNIDNLQALGRSEDFVDVTSCQWVELTQDEDDLKERIKSPYSMYVHKEDIVHENELGADIGYFNIKLGGTVGTVYYATKSYTIDAKTGCRKFVKIPVVYAEGHFIEAEDLQVNKRVWIDTSKEDEPLLVDLL